MTVNPKELRAQLNDLLNKKLGGERFSLAICLMLEPKGYERADTAWTYVEIEVADQKPQPLMAISPDGAIHNALSRNRISAKPLGNVQSSAALVKAISKIKETA